LYGADGLEEPPAVWVHAQGTRALLSDAIESEHLGTRLQPQHDPQVMLLVVRQGDGTIDREL